VAGVLELAVGIQSHVEFGLGLLHLNGGFKNLFLLFSFGALGGLNFFLGEDL